MNVIFEGMNGSGKTSIITTLCDQFEKDNINYNRISDLSSQAPNGKKLGQLFLEHGPLLTNYDQKTSLLVTKYLIEDHIYIQENLIKSDSINIFDRDIISLISYQLELYKYENIRAKEIENLIMFYKNFKNKHYDLLVYIDTALNECIKRAQERDGIQFSETDKLLMSYIKEYMEQIVKEYHDKGTNTIHINGKNSLDESASLVYEKVRSLK